MEKCSHIIPIDNKFFCPKCGKELETREGSFYLREIGSFAGKYCKPCNSLWNAEGFCIYCVASKRENVVNQIIQERY